MMLNDIVKRLKTRSRVVNRSGQSTVEYILLVAAVIAVMIVLLTNNGTGVRGQLSTTVNTVTNTMDVHANRLDVSHTTVAGDGISRPEVGVLANVEFPDENVRVGE